MSSFTKMMPAIYSNEKNLYMVILAVRWKFSKTYLLKHMYDFKVFFEQNIIYQKKINFSFLKDKEKGCKNYILLNVMGKKVL